MGGYYSSFLNKQRTHSKVLLITNKDKNQKSSSAERYIAIARTYKSFAYDRPERSVIVGIKYSSS